MSERERRLCLVRQWNRTLDEENARLFDRLCRKERECLELTEANANLRVERDAADVLLSAAMDGGTGESELV